MRAALSAFIAITVFSCSKGEDKSEQPTMNTPVRPLLYQVVLAGGISLDQSMNSIVPKDGNLRKLRLSARPPLWGLYELFKGPDMKRLETAAVVSLNAPFGQGEGAGRPQLAEVLKQAGIDVVSIATSALAAAEPEQVVSTVEALKDIDIKPLGTADGQDALAPVTVDLGGVKLALLGLCLDPDARGGAGVSTADPEKGGDVFRAVKTAAEKARAEADMVILSAEWSERQSFDARASLARKLVDEAGVDVLFGHHGGPYEGIEARGSRLIVYNTGPALLPKSVGDVEKPALVVRLHLDKSGVHWAEIQPITVTGGSSRIGMGRSETYGTIAQVAALSKELGTNVSKELGRGIVDLKAGSTATHNQR